MYTITTYLKGGDKEYSHEMTKAEITKQIKKLDAKNFVYTIFEVIDGGKDHIEVSKSIFN